MLAFSINVQTQSHISPSFIFWDYYQLTERLKVQNFMFGPHSSFFPVALISFILANKMSRYKPHTAASQPLCLKLFWNQCSAFTTFRTLRASYFCKIFLSLGSLVFPPDSIYASLAVEPPSDKAHSKRQPSVCQVLPRQLSSPLPKISHTPNH